MSDFDLVKQFVLAQVPKQKRVRKGKAKKSATYMIGQLAGRKNGTTRAELLDILSLEFKNPLTAITKLRQANKLLLKDGRLYWNFKYNLPKK